jgi:hypothetical protein
LRRAQCVVTLGLPVELLEETFGGVVQTQQWPNFWTDVKDRLARVDPTHVTTSRLPGKGLVLDEVVSPDS